MAKKYLTIVFEYEEEPLPFFIRKISEVVSSYHRVIDEVKIVGAATGNAVARIEQLENTIALINSSKDRDY